VRHAAIAHSSVLVYNVETLLVKYVHASGTRAAHAPLCYLASSQQQPFLLSPTVLSFYSPLYASVCVCRIPGQIGNSIMIAADSLRALARVAPQDYSMPVGVPRSHAPSPAAAPRGRGRGRRRARGEHEVRGCEDGDRGFNPALGEPCWVV